MPISPVVRAPPPRAVPGLCLHPDRRRLWAGRFWRSLPPSPYTGVATRGQILPCARAIAYAVDMSGHGLQRCTMLCFAWSIRDRASRLRNEKAEEQAAKPFFPNCTSFFQSERSARCRLTATQVPHSGQTRRDEHELLGGRRSGSPDVAPKDGQLFKTF